MKKYLVIGNPIDHSLSPKLHNSWLKEKNIDASYDKAKLNTGEIESLIDSIRKQKIAGCNITVPFKKIVIPFLDKLTSEAKETQSVNTIVFDDGNLIGHNTDISGFDKAIKSLNFNMKGKKIFVLGAGGVVPSIIFVLKNMNVSEIVISNRTREKAENLKNQFNNIKVLDWGETSDFDVIINATSLGLNKEKINLNFSTIGKNKLFYDVIYNPRETKFLKEAKEHGKFLFFKEELITIGISLLNDCLGP